MYGGVFSFIFVYACEYEWWISCASFLFPNLIITFVGIFKNGFLSNIYFLVRLGLAEIALLVLNETSCLTV